MDCKHNKAYLVVGNQSGSIDQEIYDLIKEIWGVNHPTVTCCADKIDDLMSITFRCSHGAEYLLTCVNDAKEKNVAGSLTVRSQTYQGDIQDGWVLGIGIMIPGAATPNAGQIHIGVEVLFPKSDYDEVLRRVKAYNK